MRPFRPRGKQGLGTYYEVPLEVLENARELERWAGAAVRTQRGGPKRR
jgi:hypothetical protein